MTIKPIEEKRRGPVEIDLTGPEGNAFVLMGYAQKWAKDLKEELLLLHGITDPKEIIDEMKSGDYEHLLQTMEKYFGKYIIMYR